MYRRFADLRPAPGELVPASGIEEDLSTNLTNDTNGPARDKNSNTKLTKDTMARDQETATFRRREARTSSFAPFVSFVVRSTFFLPARCAGLFVPFVRFVDKLHSPPPQRLKREG
jgi:hypothetical protein